MKSAFIVAILSLLFAYSSKAQGVHRKQPAQLQRTPKNSSGKDSALYKLVKGIDAAIKQRANDMGAHYLGAYIVGTEKSYIIVDSLINFNINDFKKITVTLDANQALYGSFAGFGVISLEMKTDSTVHMPVNTPK